MLNVSILQKKMFKLLSQKKLSVCFIGYYVGIHHSLGRHLWS